jgi:hypothetical protein
MPAELSLLMRLIACLPSFQQTKGSFLYCALFLPQQRHHSVKNKISKLFLVLSLIQGLDIILRDNDITNCHQLFSLALLS